MFYNGAPPGGTGSWKKLGRSSTTALTWTLAKLLGKEK